MPVIIYSNMRLLFNLKDKMNHASSVVHEENCNCGEYYIVKQDETLP